MDLTYGSMFALERNKPFDYFNNNVYEFGGQSVSALLLSNWDFTDRVSLVTQFGVGADWFLFLRNSYFTHPDAYDISQRSPQLRVYATWDAGR